MRIYIASSWKNQHGVEMLTAVLRGAGHTVLSFVENNHGEYDKKAGGKPVSLEKWIWSRAGQKSFRYDVDGATMSDLVIYYGPSGNDAAAEMGAAWHAGVPILGLWAKGTDLGLMRRMATKWFTDYNDLLDEIGIRSGQAPKD